ncbi:MAG: hypothetical protein WDN46_08315 [Methylocella sp.]
MSFWIEFLKGGDIVDSTFWRGDLASARMSAIDGFEVRKKQIDATFVRVIDVKRQRIVLSFPETMTIGEQGLERR